MINEHVDLQIVDSVSGDLLCFILHRSPNRSLETCDILVCLDMPKTKNRCNSINYSDFDLISYWQRRTVYPHF